jgi:hypothetical protein
VSASRLYYEFRLLWESFEAAGEANTLDASGVSVVVSAPAADIILSTIDAGTAVVRVSAPTAVFDLVLHAGTPVVRVVAPTASHVFVVAAGGATVTVSAPAVTLETTVGTPTIRVSAPTATLEVGDLTRDAGLVAVVVSAPAVEIFNGLVRDACLAEIEVSAPAVTLDRSAGTISILVIAPSITTGGGLTLDASGAVITVSAPAATISNGWNRAAGGATVTASAPAVEIEVARRIGLYLTTSGPLWTITDPPIEPPPLNFEILRTRGRIPQIALYLYLYTRTVVISIDGIAGLEDEGADVIKEGISVGDLVEGNDGNGIEFHLLPQRRSTFSVHVANTTGRMSNLVASDPIVGADAELFLYYPEIGIEDRFSRRKGEVVGLELTDQYLMIEAGRE